jgi:uncharacterized protein (TIGR02145 family)
MQTKTHTLTRLAFGAGLSLLVLACGDDNATSPQPPVESDPASSSSLVAEPSSSSVSGAPSGEEPLSSSATQAEPSSSSLALVEEAKKSYKTVQIGAQEWMAENMNDIPSNGNAWCYGDKPANCAIYGRLYDWATAMGLDTACNSKSCIEQINEKHQGICQSGWHIPTPAEWNTLEGVVGGADISTAGDALKSTLAPSAGGFDDKDATDSYGFSALPGGYRTTTGRFEYGGEAGHWLSATEYESNQVHTRSLHFFYGSLLSNPDYKKQAYSVRCVKD